MHDPFESSDSTKRTSSPGGTGWQDPRRERNDEGAGQGSAAYPIVGEVRGFQNRSESSGPQHQTIVWTFRVERFDPSGNRLPPVPVEMRSKSFRGFINEGDRVGVSARWREGDTLRVRKLRNLSTGAMVVARASLGWTMVLKVFLFIVILLFIGTIAITLLQKRPIPRPTKIKLTYRTTSPAEHEHVSSTLVQTVAPFKSLNRRRSG
jgi:hypothetical protein